MLDFKDRAIVILTVTLAVVVLATVIGFSLQNRNEATLRADMMNQLAEKDKTIEEQKGLYTKLTLQSKSAQDVLDSKDKQIQELQQQIKKEHEKVLEATQLIVTWKRNYESAVASHQTEVKTPDGKTRDRVDFDHDFGYISVKGYTLTNPPEGWVSLRQGRPLKMTLVLTQGRDSSWRTYATSSEENVQLEIAVTSVNPYILEPRWYEKLALRGDLGVGSTDRGLGLLVGLGVTMELGRFDMGPAGWLVVTDRVDKYIGIMIGYHPFQR